jgi:hypothetical protein
VHRQTSTDYRDAIQELRRDPEAGFEKLDRMGAVREVPVTERAQAVALAYVESKGQDVLVVCATHEENDRVTEAIRSTQKQNGSLGESVQLERDVALNWTASQKSDARNFLPGQRLMFHRAVKGIAKKELLEVVRADGKTIVARNSRGEEHSVSGKHAKAFDVYERRQLRLPPATSCSSQPIAGMPPSERPTARSSLYRVWMIEAGFTSKTVANCHPISNNLRTAMR